MHPFSTLSLPRLPKTGLINVASNDDFTLRSIGESIDSVTMLKRAAALKTPVVEIRKHVTQTWSVQIIRTSRQLLNALGYSLSASFSNGAFSASAKFRKYQSLQLNNSSVYVVAVAQLMNHAETIKGDTELRSDVRALLRPPNCNSDKFYERHGDSYISAMLYGIEFSTLLEIKTSSYDSANSIEASLRLSSVIGGVSGSVNDAKTELEKYSMSAVTNHITGSKKNGLNLDVEKTWTLLDSIFEEYRTGAPDAAIVLCELTSADVAQNWPSDRASPQTEYARKTLDSLSQLADSIDLDYTTLSEISDNSPTYHNLDSAKLTTRIELNRRLHAAVTSAQLAVLNSPVGDDQIARMEAFKTLSEEFVAREPLQVFNSVTVTHRVNKFGSWTLLKGDQNVNSGSTVCYSLHTNFFPDTASKKMFLKYDFNVEERLGDHTKIGGSVTDPVYSLPDGWDYVQNQKESEEIVECSRDKMRERIHKDSTHLKNIRFVVDTDDKEDLAKVGVEFVYVSSPVIIGKTV
ncbi:MAG: hypothetical protein ABIT37_04250 [Luteolibacter sp.]